MSSQFQSMINVLNSIHPILKKYPEEDGYKVDELVADINQRSDDSKPQIMVYGIYNSGKSTLINALLGKEVATVSAVPETDKITRYEYDGYVFYDTPGVDAPIEHEKITEEHIDKCDVVLFVMDTQGAFEEQVVYDKIASVLKKNKYLSVILNNKSGYERGDSNVMRIQDRITDNVRKCLGGIDDFSHIYKNIQVRLVNAKLALKAQIEPDKAELLEVSMLPELKRDISDFLRQTKSSEIVKSQSTRIVSVIDEKIESAKSTIKNNPLKTTMISVVEQKEGIKRSIESKTEDLSRNLECKLFDALECGSKAAVNEAWRAALDGVATQANSMLTGELNKAMERIEQVLDGELDLAKNRQQVSPSQSNLKTVNMPDEVVLEGQGSGETPSTFENSESIRVLMTSAIEKFPKEEAIVFVLKQTKDWVPSLMKGIGVKTMGKIAARYAPYIGPAISVIWSIYEYFSESNKIDDSKEKQRRQHAAQERAIDDVIFQVKDRTIEVCFSEVDKIFDGITSRLKNDLDKTNAINQEIMSDIEAMNKARGALSCI